MTSARAPASSSGRSTVTGLSAWMTNAPAIQIADRRLDASDLFGRGHVDLVDHDHVGHPQVGLARVIRGLVSGPQRIGDDDVDRRPEERQVVVASVPQHHVGLQLGALQDGLIVHARVDDGAVRDVVLVLFALLDRDAGGVEILDRREPLHALGREVSVRHRMPHDDRMVAGLPEDLRRDPRRLALAGTGANRADGHDGNPGREHGRLRPEEQEVRARGEHLARPMHHVLVRHVGVREDDVVDLQLADQLRQLRFVMDPDAVRIPAACQGGRVDPVADERDLRSGEGHHLGVGVMPIHRVEVVEVTAGRSHDHDPSHLDPSSRAPSAPRVRAEAALAERLDRRDVGGPGRTAVEARDPRRAGRRNGPAGRQARRSGVSGAAPFMRP